MFLRSLAFLTLVMSSFLSSARVSDTLYRKEWMEIDTLILQKDLTKTALGKVTQLYDRAKKESHPAQALKSLIYQSTLSERITEDNFNQSIAQLKTELATSTDEAIKAVIHSLLAKYYLRYFNNHRWNLYSRTNTVQADPENISTWSHDDFAKTITTHFQRSLQNRKLLGQTPINTIEPIVVAGNTRKVRPTLFDLLAHEAISYFQSGDNYLTKPAFAFVVKDTLALSPSPGFINAHFTTTDSTSQQWLTLVLYQELLKSHQNDPDKTAFLEADLERIEWVYTIASFEHKERRYVSALENITHNYGQSAAASQAWYLLARDAANKAATYQAFGDTTYQYGYTRAISLIEKALSLNKENNNGIANLQNLLTEIRGKQLGTQTEIVNLPNTPFRALVSYRNIDTLYGRIIRLDSKEEVTDNNNGIDVWKILLVTTPFRKLTQPLPLSEDYQPHSAEIKIDGLPLGSYALITASGAGFDKEKDKLSYQFFHVSRISYVNNKNDFFVLDRENGQPLKGVSVKVYERIYDRTNYTYKLKKISERTSDENGYYRFNEKNNYPSYRFYFQMGKDHLFLREADYIPYAYENPVNYDSTEQEKFETNNSRVYFFTDRSIYRPGQLVSFKGIAITKDLQTKQSKLIRSKDASQIYLLDVNGKKIDSILISLNSFGSFTGQFRLPQNTLTGNFMLSLPRYGQSLSYFSVEEYKRPTFQVTFDKAKGSYRLNDSVSLTGHAIAYAGNPISGAKVKYSVKRNTRYPYPWFWRSTIINPGNREISQGEIITDNEGKFTIRFMAQADDIIDKTGNPLFEFSGNADITDITGETRSGLSQVTVGLTSMLLTVTAPESSELDSFTHIKINTTNLSNEPEPASVSIRLYALQAPEHPIRKRLWQRPDQFVMTQKEFSSYFPEDEYQAESNFLNWPIGKSVLTGEINTGEKNLFTIPSGSVLPGYFRIEAKTRDKFGEEVTTITYTQLFRSNNSQLAVPSFAFTHIVNAIARPGETAVFLSGSSVANRFVIRKTERPGMDNKAYQFLQRNKGMERIQYQPTETDRGNVFITEAYVVNNRIYTHQFTINVPWNNKELQLKYASYRDKTEPGNHEKWTIEVKADNNQPAAAELLTGMYDASLDQFKNHTWNSPYLWPTNYSLTNFNALANFKPAVSIDNYLPEKYVESKEILFDRLAASGNELWEQDLKNWSNSGSHVLAPALKKRMEKYMATLQNETRSMERVMATGSGIQIRGNNSADLNKRISSGKEGIREESYDKVFTAPPPKSLQDLETVSPDGKPIADIPATGIRKNFAETAFFFPQLTADSTGTYRIQFTMPDANTQWKWMSLAHTKDLAFGTQTAKIITQKKLMVQANAPRFLREGDHMEFSGKISNLTDKEITGQVRLELLDTETGTSIDGWFQNIFPTQYFTVEAGLSSAVKFPIQIPFGYNHPLTWRLVAEAGEFSDGEENMLPVLTNRMLVTESLPLFLPDDSTRKFSFDKLLNTNSETRTNESLTLEYTTNPVWYAVQALPYLMEYPYECAEQSFNRLFANLLSTHIINKYPAIKKVFDQWKNDSTVLQSNLQKNKALKQVLLEETPWVFQAEKEAERMKNLSKLFELAGQESQTESLIDKLQQLQITDGSFSWFKGGYPDRYITQYILTGIGKLKRLGAITPDISLRIRNILVKALAFEDVQLAKDYNRLLTNKVDTTQLQVSSIQMDYLYMRSFFRDIALPSPYAYQYYYNQGKKFWVKQNNYYKAVLGLVFYRNNEEKIATGDILPALLENTVINSKQGMYWKTNYTRYWHQSPIENQTMMLAFMSEVTLNNPGKEMQKNINAMKTWLLLNKQTNNWRTTIATADACYALLAYGSDWLNTDKSVIITLGTTSFNSHQETKQAGTGYFQKRIEGKTIRPEMGNIIISTHSASNATTGSASSPSWGSLYWQYFEDLDKITAAESPLSLSKKLFLEKNTAKGKLLEQIRDTSLLHPGDKVVIRIVLKSDRDMDYLHLKDMRAASMEPLNVLSGYQWQDGLGYYESTRDASSNFFISHLSKGTYVFEYPVFITHTGVFSIGIASIQSMYAPEFTSHSAGSTIRVEGK